MRVSRANGPSGAEPNLEALRLARVERRSALLDVAETMVAAGRVDDVTMESVAVAAGVSRGLVYKHFSNRGDLLGALYERESTRLHEELTVAVVSADSLSEKFRALITGALSAQAQRGATFAALRSDSERPSRQPALQRRRDSQTVTYFARCAERELGLDPILAATGVSMALGNISTVLAQWRLDPTEAGARRLQDVYVVMAIGGLRELATGS